MVGPPHLPPRISANRPPRPAFRCRTGISPAPKDKLEEDRRKAASERLRISVKLAKLIGYGALIAVVVQVVLANATGWLTLVTFRRAIEELRLLLPQP